MFVLTRYSSNTYHAQIRAGREGKFRKLASATCTMGNLQAAQAVVTKLHGTGIAGTVREVTEPAAIAILIDGFSMNSPHKWRVWTFVTNPAAPDPELVDHINRNLESSASPKPPKVPLDPRLAAHLDRTGSNH